MKELRFKVTDKSLDAESVENPPRPELPAPEEHKP